ncbi:histidine kinase [Lentzea atacamensis]|uniref:histidine kinase n=1 Tax=Lentzea atacamensis TaxID=531938 RepID=A0A316I4C3_9PSEU|nr:ATP-binding protein [Lentzea atacamensis]PWK88311.1 histidine kinase [Lentzea atacamensis]
MRILWLGTGFLALGALVWGGYEVSVPAVVLNLAVGLSFIGAGLEAADRRPDSRSGQLMIAVGLAWFVRLAGAIENDAAFAIGVATKTFYLAVLGHLLVTYPTGRITSRWQLVVVSVAYLLTVPVNVGYLLVTPLEPQNIVVIREVSAPDVPAVAVVVMTSGIVLFGALLARMITRWLRSGSVARRDLGPVVWGGAAIGLTVVVTYLAALLGLPPGVQVALQWSTEVVLVGWPLALLYGLLRARLDRSAVGELAVSFGAGLPDDLRSVLARTLHDPSLEIVYGEVPPASRGVTYLEAGGTRLAALVHDPALDPAFVRAVAASAALAVQNELRLQRIVAAADEARRQVERDLHDGAQQRLVSVLLTLKLAESSPERLAAARDELAKALDELRELARGIYPVLLTDAGLGPALISLVERSAVPAVLVGVPEERLSPVAERTCYFVIAEALTNAIRHSQAREVRIEVTCVDGLVTVDVSDNGSGGASRLRGLDDRVAAVGGRLTVHSPVGEGTRVRAEFSDPRR